MDLKTTAQGQLRRSKRVRQKQQLFSQLPTKKRSHPTAHLPRLTKKNLLAYNTSSSKESTISSKESTISSSTNTSSTTIVSLVMNAHKNGILKLGKGDRPTNSDALLERLHSRRESESPTEDEFEKYRNRVENSMNEATAAFFVQSHVLNLDAGKEGFSFALNQRLNGIPKDVGFNNNISAPQPDFIQGLDAEVFHRTPLMDIPGILVDTNNDNSIVLPHISGEWKKLESGVSIAGKQAAYDGAALVYGRNQALEAMDIADPAGHASIITFATNGRTLDIFAHYSEPSKDDEIKAHYYQHRLATSDLHASYQTFRDGRRMLRNAQDYALEQLYQLRDQLEGHYRKKYQDSKSQ